MNVLKVLEKWRNHYDRRNTNKRRNMIIGRFNFQLVLIEDFNRVLFGIEFVKAKEFDYVLFSIGFGGLVVGYK
jgi:hypothetical protein